MPCIQLDIGSVYSRGSQIRDLLSILSLNPGGPAWHTLPAQAGSIVFAAYDGPRPGGPASDWRFLTSTLGIRANYYEKWNPVPEATLAYLDRAYLTIYQRKGPLEEAELLALHCDPDEPDGEGAIYKRGPHLHIVAAESPIPKAHIALAITHLSEVLASASNLMEALGRCIIMIRDEVLARYNES